MESFDNAELKKILSLWKGNIEFHKKDGKISKIELSKRYDFDFLDVDNNADNSNTNSIYAIEKVINGYGFLKVEGDLKGITIIATVKPQSLNDFKTYCVKLKSVDTLLNIQEINKIKE